jgi:two-component system CheB/CheR fusion protein
VSAVLRALRTATGVDFSEYKLATVRRRVARRMLLQRIDDFETYARHLRQTSSEAQALRDDLLIQVTGFFRDPKGFEVLRRHVFPTLLRERAAHEPLRIWVPGCATGEETYSLTICLLELLEETDSTVPIQVFGTDLSHAAIARARAGTFPASIENEVSGDRLRRFFVKTHGRYQVSKAIRDVCVFAPHDLTRDPPFSKLDLISCCNVLIYLGAALQERVLPVFHYALKPAGFLKLGPSESVGRFTNLFSLIDKKHKLYTRTTVPSAYIGFGLAAADRIAAPARTTDKELGWSTSAIEKEADRLVLGRYAPAGVVVNPDMQIVQFRGPTGPYLEATPGTASFDLFKMARGGLGPALRQAMSRAAKRGPVKAEGLRVKINGRIRDVSLEVIPFGPAHGTRGRHHLILFSDARRRGVAVAPAPRSASRSNTPRDRQLTRELADARRHLQAVGQEHEAAMEELRAAAEEAQSSNEELQSLNEELETAKEELQATNEELITVNDELASRNTELALLNDDLSNFLTNSHVPMLMVGLDLRVRRMTPVTERALNMTAGDVGRPIRDLRLGVEVPRLEALIREVIETLSLQEREVESRDGRWYSVRIRPYRTLDNKIDGTVISFIDIDAVKRALEDAKTARDHAQAIVATVREPLVILDADLRVVTANRSFYETFRVTPEETERQSLFDLGNRQWNIPRLRTLLEEILPRENAFEGFEVEHDFQTIGRRAMLLNARCVLSAAGKQALILLAIEDVTEAKRALVDRERAVRAEAESEAKDKFVAVVSHELRTPLTPMLGWIRMLRTQTLDPAIERGLDVIERNVRQEARLVEDLLDASRIVAGTLSLEARPVFVAPAVEAALAAMRPAAEAKGVHLEDQLDGSAGPVQGDPARLQQIVWNLVSNAIKFTPTGGRVDVHLARRGSSIEIAVRDTGRGIAAEQLPRIFGRFGAPDSTSRSQGGLGVGLAIVRYLVELHGGTVQAASPGLGQGATFTVTVPLTDHRPAGEAEVRRRADRDRASDQLPSLGGVRILVVDDEDDGRELVRAVLAQCGAEVTVAATAPAALEALAQASFDVLVSDIAMPEHTGYDLIRHVRALDPERGGRIPALALTAYARIEDREAALSIGYQHHATKPIEPAELAAAVAALARRAARQRRERSESPRAASRSRRQSRPKPRRRPPDHPR